MLKHNTILLNPVSPHCMSNRIHKVTVACCACLATWDIACYLSYLVSEKSKQRHKVNFYAPLKQSWKLGLLCSIKLQTGFTQHFASGYVILFSLNWNCSSPSEIWVRHFRSEVSWPEPYRTSVTVPTRRAQVPSTFGMPQTFSLFHCHL
jgi:hypothetical protein